MSSVSTAALRWSSSLDDAVSALAWSHDGTCLWAGTAQGTLSLLDRSGEVVGIGPPHRRRITALATDPMSGTVASATDRGLLVLQGPDTTRHHLDVGSRPRSLCWSSDNGLLAITTQAAGLLVVDQHARRVAALPASRKHLCAAWHDPVGPHQLAVGGAGSLRWLDVALADPVTETRPHPGVTLAMAAAPGGQLALGDLRGAITIVDTSRQTDLQISGWPDAVRQLCWVGGSQHVVVVGGDELTAWTPADELDDARSPSEAEPAPSHPPRTSPDGSPLTGIAAHPWRPGLAAATEAGTVVAWFPGSGARIDVTGEGPPVSSLSWSPTGDVLAVGRRDGSVALLAPDLGAAIWD